MAVCARKRIVHDYERVSVQAETLAAPLDLPGLFGRVAPVHVEIGSGKGTFLWAQARSHPECNFLGVEWANRYYRYAVDRMGRWGVTNVRLIRTDAADFVRQSLADETVDAFHVYFPDPWPKKRHHKRRFFQDQNVEQLWRALRSGGLVQFVTDHEPYCQAAREVLARQADRWQEVPFERPAGAAEGEIVGTNYERKYRVESRAIYALAVRKRRPMQ
jgi:tRNA (guanine-N7-)-methyltransferase